MASENHSQFLKPFYQRASDAEDRLSKLEASLASKGDYGHVDPLKKVSELQSKLELVTADLVSEREKAQKEIEKLATENAKMQYRVTHLVRALKEADNNFGSSPWAGGQ